MYWGTSPTKYVMKKPLSRFNLISNNTQVYFSTLIKMFNQYLKLSVGYFHTELYESINTFYLSITPNAKMYQFLQKNYNGTVLISDYCSLAVKYDFQTAIAEEQCDCHGQVSLTTSIYIQTPPLTCMVSGPQLTCSSRCGPGFY